jgi:hypothetical protein
MARRHEDALTCLGRLLDRHEDGLAREGGSTARVIAEQVSQSFDHPEEQDAFRRRIEAAQRAGAVRLEMERKSGLRHLMKRVVLLDADKLYAHLGREPRGDLVGRAIGALRARLEAKLGRTMEEADDCLSFALGRLEERWAAGKSCQQVAAGDVDAAFEFLVAVEAALTKPEDDMRDLRTYSRQRCGDSKLIEHQMSRVLGIAREMGRLPEDIPDVEAISALGLEKFPHLVQLAGDLPDYRREFERRLHFGLHPDLVEDLEIPELKSLLTIENYASFNRHVREVMGPGEVVVYTGGWPGRSEAKLIRRLAERADAVAHWGDIDMAGAGIADAVWRAAGRDITLHLMDPSLAKSQGHPMVGRPIAVDEASPGADLVRWLASAEAHVLEQEELDPASVEAPLALAGSWWKVSRSGR